MKVNENKRENWRKPNTQQSNTIQKINQLQDAELIPEDNCDDDGNVFEEIPKDLISNATHESSDIASTFLSE